MPIRLLYTIRTHVALNTRLGSKCVLDSMVGTLPNIPSRFNGNYLLWIQCGSNSSARQQLTNYPLFFVLIFFPFFSLYSNKCQWMEQWNTQFIWSYHTINCIVRLSIAMLHFYFIRFTRSNNANIPMAHISLPSFAVRIISTR